MCINNKQTNQNMYQKGKLNTFNKDKATKNKQSLMKMKENQTNMVRPAVQVIPQSSKLNGLSASSI
jgi:hypothetical protein